MNIANIQTETRALVDADTVSYPAALMLIRNNTAMEKVADIILGADGRWQWDDTNNADYPDGVAILSNLVSAQKSYAIDTSLIKVRGVSILNQSGLWRKLLPFDADTDLNNSSTPLSFIPLVNFGPTMDRAEFLKTPSAPQFYDVEGNYTRLYPPPDNGISVTLTNGLKIYGQRTAQLFTSAEVTTGTKVPGFASQFHHIIAYLSALPYAQSYKKDRVPMIQQEIIKVMGDPDRGVTGALARFYGKRDKDFRPVMTTRKIKYI